MINVYSEEEKKQIDKFNVDLTQNSRKDSGKITRRDSIKETKIRDSGFGINDLEFLKKTQCIVRVYIVDAGDLAAKDDNSNSDPYLRLELGDTVFDVSTSRFGV